MLRALCAATLNSRGLLACQADWPARRGRHGQASVLAPGVHLGLHCSRGAVAGDCPARGPSSSPQAVLEEWWRRFLGGRGSRGPRWRVSKGGARRARQARATWLLPVRPQVRGAASCERLRPRIYMRLRTVWNDIRPLPDHAGSSQGPLRIPKLQHLGTQASLLVVVLKLCLRIGAFGRGSTCTYGNLWRPPAHAHDGW